MCGYCIETTEIIQALIAVYGGRPMPLKWMLAANFLQEHKNLAVALRRVVQTDKDHVCWDVVQCRLLESYVLKGFDKKRYRRLVVAAGGSLFEGYLGREDASLIMHPVTERWNILWEPQLYADGRQWSDFLAASELLEANAAETLAFYTEWWLEGRCREKNNLDDLFRQTGILDPIQETTKSAWEQFYRIFPAIYFSLVYLWPQSKNMDLIERIALTVPDGVPDFYGYDLWLQRKAFCLFATTVGIHEAIRQAEEIRMALIWHALLTLPLNQQELSLAFDAIDERREHLVDSYMPIEEEIDWLKRVVLR